MTGGLRNVNVDGVARLPGWVHARIAGDLVFVAGTLGTSGADFTTVVDGGIGAPHTGSCLVAS